MRIPAGEMVAPVDCLLSTKRRLDGHAPALKEFYDKIEHGKHPAQHEQENKEGDQVAATAVPPPPAAAKID
jgi:hypothetical protein